jgi:hypothetical protein
MGTNGKLNLQLNRTFEALDWNVRRRPEGLERAPAPNRARRQPFRERRDEPVGAVESGQRAAREVLQAIT